MKLLYFLLVHTNSKQVVRLINRLNTPKNQFVIHVSKNCEPGIYEHLLAAFNHEPNIAFAKRIKVKWGNFDVVQAALNCMEITCTKKYEYDRAYILSGQDYPLQSNEAIESKLAEYEGQQIMEFFPLPDDVRGHGQNRWRYYYFWIGKRHIHVPLVHQPANPLLRIPAWLVNTILPKRKIPNGWQLYGGSFWSSFTPRAVDYFYNFPKTPEGRQVTSFLKSNLHPGEMFLQTVLMNSPLKHSVVNENLHYIKFPSDSGHPVFFTANEIEDIGKNNELFARKIDSRVDEQILDLLDQKLNDAPKKREINSCL